MSLNKETQNRSPLREHVLTLSWQTVNNVKTSHSKPRVAQDKTKVLHLPRTMNIQIWNFWDSFNLDQITETGTDKHRRGTSLLSSSLSGVSTQLFFRSGLIIFSKCHFGI